MPKHNDKDTEIGRLLRYLEILVPVAHLYVGAFTDDDRITMIEALRLTQVQDTLAEMDADE